MKDTLASLKKTIKALSAEVVRLTAELESVRAQVPVMPTGMPLTYESIPDDLTPWLSAACGKRASIPGPVLTLANQAAQALGSRGANVGGLTMGERERNAWRWLQRNSPNKLPGWTPPASVRAAAKEMEF